MLLHLLLCSHLCPGDGCVLLLAGRWLGWLGLEAHWCLGLELAHLLSKALERALANLACAHKMHAFVQV
jgi:hypothetical protein